MLKTTATIDMPDIEVEYEIIGSLNIRDEVYKKYEELSDRVNEIIKKSKLRSDSKEK